VALGQAYADAVAAYLVVRPATVDVLLTSNLVGDVRTDLGSAVQGSIGLAASADVSPTRHSPGMFEPAHGFAFDSAGTGVANPVAAVWSGALLLEDLGHCEAAARIMGAVRHIFRSGGSRTVDLGGVASTKEVGQAIEKALTHPSALNPHEIAQQQLTHRSGRSLNEQRPGRN
jgi:tartrate dehydrogenase/decarboxylase / D-malate dehydrogenase